MNTRRLANHLFYQVIALINFSLTDDEMTLVYERCYNAAKQYTAGRYN